MPLVSNDIIIEPDLKVKDGDLSIEVSDDRNVEYITYSGAGQVRRKPTLGVEIVSFVNAPTQDGRNIRKKIRQELEKDGYVLKELDSETNKEDKTTIKIKAVKTTSKL